MAAIHIGISGWRYTPWRGDFYPDGLTQKRELQFASRAVSSIEINGSFYALQTPSAMRSGTPIRLRGSCSASRRHAMSRISCACARCTSPWPISSPPGCWSSKKTRSHPLAVPAQLQIRRRAVRSLPGRFTHQHPTGRRPRPPARAASERQGKHESLWQKPLRHAVEIRHMSFAVPEFVQLLDKYGVALVVADTAGKWPYIEDVTANFMYLRLHGDKQLYASGYTSEALKRWGDRIERWAHGKQPADAHLVAPQRKPRVRKQRDVFCFSTMTSRCARLSMRASCCSASGWTSTCSQHPGSCRNRECCHDSPELIPVPPPPPSRVLPC